jgi:hypothetical protein
MIVKRGIFFQEKGRRLNNHAGAYVLIFFKKGDLGWSSSKAESIFVSGRFKVVF